MSSPRLRYSNVTPAMAEGGNVQVPTSGTGSDWVAFAAKELAQMTLINDTGTTIEWRQDESTVTIPLADGEVFTIFGIDDANRISVRRADLSNSIVNVKARWER